MKQIFIHGLGQTPESWNKTVGLLGTEGNNICPNLAELSPSDASYQSLYAAFSELCGRFDEPPDLCGLSLGAVLALHYTLEHPEKVRSLVLIAPQYKMPKRLLQIQNLLFRLMPESMFRQEGAGFGKKEFIRLCGTMAELDFSGDISKITCPALVICGEKDSANKKSALTLADKLPQGEFVLVKDCGHEINTESPEKLAEILKDFYRRI